MASITLNAWLQFGLYMVVLLALARPLGNYMAAVYEGRPTWLTNAVGPLERGIYRLCGIPADQEMGWKAYAAAMIGIAKSVTP